jgi:hypothetical protein
MKFKSSHPPVSFQSKFNKQWFVVCSTDGDGWVKVNRGYSWNELEKLWDKIQYETPKTMEKIIVKKEYKVKGSKGNVYKVENDNGWWSCSCPAFGFGRGKDCKHIIQLKNKK